MCAGSGDPHTAAVWVCAVLLVLIGCSTIHSVHIDAGKSPALTPEQAQRYRSEGKALYGLQPRTVPRVTSAALLLEQAARALRDDYDVLCGAAQALAFVAENETRPNIRRDAAERGIVLARQARGLKSDRVEAHYWFAINVGLLADVDRSYGLDAVGEMEAALKRAIEIDEKYDYAGPLRVLGILHLRTPAPPVSIGSKRKGLRLLVRAVADFPDYPENYLYLAEALRDNDRASEARQALDKVLNAAVWPDRQFESAQWKTAARQSNAVQ